MGNWDFCPTKYKPNQMEKFTCAQTAGVLCRFGEEAELRRKGANLTLKSTAEMGNVWLGQ
jgi:hypothetical protein